MFKSCQAVLCPILLTLRRKLPALLFYVPENNSLHDNTVTTHDTAVKKKKSRQSRQQSRFAHLISCPLLLTVQIKCAKRIVQSRVLVITHHLIYCETLQKQRSWWGYTIQLGQSLFSQRILFSTDTYQCLSYRHNGRELIRHLTMPTISITWQHMAVLPFMSQHVTILKITWQHMAIILIHLTTYGSTLNRPDNIWQNFQLTWQHIAARSIHLTPHGSTATVSEIIEVL